MHSFDISPAPALRVTLLALLLSVLVSGCGTAPSQRQPEPDPVLQQAQALDVAGDHAGAARLYQQAAASASGAQQQSLQLLAVDSLIRASELDTAQRLLDDMPQPLANAELQQGYHINRAKLALAGQRPAEALQLLQQVAEEGPYRAERHRLRAIAYQQEFRYFLSARERVLLDPLLTDPEAQLENQFAIWETLDRLTDAELQQLRTAPAPDPLSGWIELVELSRLYLQQPDALAEVTPHWQQRYPNHPASTAFIPRLLENMRLAGQPPAQIAVLLPLNGKLADAAAAIRDGVLAAYYDTPAGSVQPQLQIYDSGDSGESALAAYQQAVLDGAQFVIGPLRKEAVQALAALPQLTVPVLALNQLEEPALYSPLLYQFGLAPEDEAREAARLAWHQGYTRGIALLPDSEWGERVFRAFAHEWQQLGGELLDTLRYDSSQTDHGTLISAALNLDNSKARQQQLTRQLGVPLEYEPRRRKDVDFFFMVAAPNQARLIRPQLSFYRASNLPVFSTSRVYSGQANAEQDADMNGIIFCDMPWTLDADTSWQHLQQTIHDFWPTDASRYARLYALGIDAYRLAPYLGSGSAGMFGAYRGVTGNLSLAGSGIVSRTLRCAEFRHGVPVLLEQAETQEVSSSGTGDD